MRVSKQGYDGMRWDEMLCGGSIARMACVCFLWYVAICILTNAAMLLAACDGFKSSESKILQSLSSCSATVGAEICLRRSHVQACIHDFPTEISL